MKTVCFARWISGTTEGDNPEFVYASAPVASGLDAAKARAIEKGKSADVAEWAGVEVRDWIGDPRTGYWRVTERHMGDWDGHWECEVQS